MHPDPPEPPSTRRSRAEFAPDAAAVTAAMAAEALGLQRQFEHARSWLAECADDSGRWSDAAFAAQSRLRLTPEELRELSAELWRCSRAGAPGRSTTTPTASPS